MDLRPLDPVRSIKTKLGILVAASTLFAAVLTYYGLNVLGWLPRHTLPVAVLLTLGISQVLAHGMTSPLRQMTAAARALAAGRPTPPVTTRSRDEVGELARAFTAMARQLESVDAQRRELLADVGHELRTPVAAIRAQVENLADGVRPADPPALAEVLAQVERLGDLLTDLLDLARADGGAVPLTLRPVPLMPLLDGVVAEVGAARPERSIEVDVDPPDLFADADPHRLGQVVTNLVDNAARHARRVVVVRARARDEGGVVLEVVDDGPGIRPARWETVFERFGTGTGPLPVVGARPPDGGTGLGLAIARWAVVLHGGTIRIVPTPDGGCCIRVELPPAPR